MISKFLRNVLWAAQVVLQTALASGPLDTWHLRDSKSPGQPLNDVVYANGLFVAVGANGILTSPNGADWTQPASGTNVGLVSVVYGSGIFLARNAYTLLRSTDGTNWNSSAWTAEEKIEGLDFANDRFFVLSHDLRVNGDHVIIFTSTNAINWTRFNTGLSGVPGAVTYANGLYVEVGSASPTAGPAVSIPLVLTSSDAKTWSGFYYDSALYWDKYLEDVAYGSGKFVATFGTVGAGGIMSSLDGTNWTVRLAGPPVDSIAFGDGVFVAAGSVGSLLTSTDGMNWTVRDPGTNYWLGGVTYGQNTFVAVGAQGRIIQSDPIVTLRLTVGTSTELSLIGPPGRTCEIHAVDQLLATNNWQTLGTVTLTNTAVSWTDAEATNKPQRFYRAVLQP